jgi:preprotein translocase subunit SecG
MLQSIVLFIHLLLAFMLIGLVLIQHGKGADAGAAFGSGSSGTVFGSAGSATFLTKFTTLVAALFAVTSISLTILATKGTRPQSLSDKLMQQESVQAPPAPVDAPLAPPVLTTAPASDLPSTTPNP